MRHEMSLPGTDDEAYWLVAFKQYKCLPHRWSCWVIPSILCPPAIPYFTTLILGVDDALCPRWCASLIKEDPGFLLFLPREGSFYASRSKSFFSKKKGKGTQHSVAFAIALPTTRQLLFPSTSMLGCYSVLGGREKNSLQCYLRSLPEQICEDQAFWLYPQSWARSCLPGSTFLTSSVPN